MYAIGIDIGTTSICGVVLDAVTGKVVRSRTETSNAFIATKNSWEKIQDTEKIIALAVGILEDLCEYPAVVIGLTGQMHGIVYVDADGKAVSPLYTWQDGRGTLPYKNTTYAEYLGSFSGYGNVTDFYNRVNDLRPENAAAHCTIMDYLGMVLCGLKRPKIHSTNAASMGCFDLEKKSFTYDVAAEISDGFDIIGTYKGIPVSVAIGDNQASVFSTLAEEEDILINVGTGSQVSVVSSEIKSRENIETRPYFDGKYLVVGSALCGGRAYGVLKEFFAGFLQAAGISDVDIYEIMNRLATEKKRADMTAYGDDAKQVCDGLNVDTRFAGTRHQPELCGGITGITVDNFTPANLTFGFLAGMVEELYSMFEQMGEYRKNIVGSGNGIRKNGILVQLAEERFEGSMKVPIHMEEAAYGAALFGLVACGMCENAQEAQKIIKFENFTKYL